MRILAIANQKGGTSKTTTTVSLAGCLAEMGRKVLLVDLDPQASATMWLLDPDPASIESDDRLLSLMTETLEPDERAKRLNAMIQPVEEIDNLFVLPSSRTLALANSTLVTKMRKDHRLQMLLGGLDDSWDDVLIDTPPSLEILAINAAVAADEILVPVTAEAMSLHGVGHLFNFLKEMRMLGLNENLRVIGVVTTRFRKGPRLQQDVHSDLKSNLPDLLFDTVIHESVRLQEAPAHLVPIHVHDPSGRSSKEYRQLTEELLRRRAS